MSVKSRPGPVKVAILGAQGVGKTAFAVRYITKRFIGDYESEKETLYSHRTLIDKDETQMEILDALVDEESIIRHIGWADGIVMLYSVTDHASFMTVDKCLTRIQSHKSSQDGTLFKDRLPTVVVANKTDMSHNRVVGEDQGSGLRLKYRHPVFEISVAEMPRVVQDVMQELVIKIKRELSKSAVVSHSEKKSALTNMRRVFKQKITRSKSDNTM